MDEGLITITIPAALLPTVTELMHQHFVGAPPAADSDAPVELHGVSWRRRDVAAVHARHRSDRARAEVRLIAQRSVENLPTDYGMLAEHVGTDSFGLRSDLAWLGRHAAAVHGRPAFPLVVTDAGAKAPAGQRYTYLMPRRMAHWWLEIDQQEIDR
jgi:hypothetical protein